MGITGPQIRFTNVVVSNVEPLKKTPHVESIDPTDFDIPLLDMYVPVLFFFRLADNSDATYAQAVNQMKEGLRRVLVPFFPWAGRRVATPGGMRRQLLCNDKGVPFIEASVDEDMDSVAKMSVEFQPVQELVGWEVFGMDKMSLMHPNLPPDGHPCVLVQVTRFKCGGLVFAFTISHMLTGGRGGSHFLAAWSDFSRTNKSDKIIDHNRGAVMASTLILPPSADTEDAQAARGKVKIFEVRASVIELLQREAQEIANGARVSINDCIHVHIWKTAASVSINDGKEIPFATAVEGRQRFFDRPMPNLLGNAFLLMMPPKISTTELLSMPVSLIASKTREKIVTTAKETWHSPQTILEWWTVRANDQVAAPWGVTSWTTFFLYGLDFGFGKPLFLGMNYCLRGGPLQTHVVVTPPTPGVSSSAACVAITTRDAEHLEALERHPDFLPFFVPHEEVKRQLAAHYGRKQILPTARLQARLYKYTLQV